MPEEIKTGGISLSFLLPLVFLSLLHVPFFFFCLFLADRPSSLSLAFFTFTLRSDHSRLGHRRTFLFSFQATPSSVHVLSILFFSPSISLYPFLLGLLACHFGSAPPSSPSSIRFSVESDGFTAVPIRLSSQSRLYLQISVLSVLPPSRSSPTLFLLDLPPDLQLLIFYGASCDPFFRCCDCQEPCVRVVPSTVPSLFLLASVETSFSSGQHPPSFPTPSIVPPFFICPRSPARFATGPLSQGIACPCNFALFHCSLFGGVFSLIYPPSPPLPCYCNSRSVQSCNRFTSCLPPADSGPRFEARVLSPPRLRVILSCTPLFGNPASSVCRIGRWAPYRLVLPPNDLSEMLPFRPPAGNPGGLP